MHLLFICGMTHTHYFNHNFSLSPKHNKSINHYQDQWSMRFDSIKSNCVFSKLRH